MTAFLLRPPLVAALLLLAAAVSSGQDQPNPPQPNAADADTPAPVAPGAEPMTNVQFPNTPIPTILLEYERLTGKKVIRDANVQDKSLIIQTSGEMTYPEAAEFIEKSFLLNGYAIIPTEEPDQMKIIAFNVDKRLSSEGLPVITTPFNLPESDQVVTYIMPLAYLAPDAAAELFSNIVELHPYGRITALQNASAIVITESSPVIRRLIELRDHLDVSPIKTESESFQLERADAEDVVEALIDILQLDQEAPGGDGAINPQNPGQAPVPRAPQGNAPGDEIIPSQTRSSAAFTKANTPKPRVRAIPRANRVLVVAAPTDMQYIADIIHHLDAPVETSNYMSRKLRFIDVREFLEIAGNVILRGMGDEDSQQSQIVGGDQNNTGSNNQNTGLGNQNDFNDNSNSNSFGSSGTRGASGNLGSAGSDQAAAPASVVIDKTLLIADNVQNMLIASGPPEHLLLIDELLDQMDVRPVQIQISAVIAQLNLGDDFEFGFDLLRSFENPANGELGNAGGSFVSRAGQSRTLLDTETLTDVTNLLPAAQGLTFYGQLNNYLDVFVSALESTNRLKILSRPMVYTVNNRQAVIETGQRVAVPRSTLSSVDFDDSNPNQVVTANIDYVDVVLRISVLPLINSEGEITLQIQQQNDSIVGSQIIGGDSIPTIGTQTLGTTIIVDDGGTVLLGGLINEGDQKSESGLPLFGNLPLIGRVFGSTIDNANRQELLIFIQPKIIENKCDHFAVDQDAIDRTRVGESAIEFSKNEDNNIDLFESQDFNSPEKRIHFFRNLFKKKYREPAPNYRAVPVE